LINFLSGRVCLIR